MTNKPTGCPFHHAGLNFSSPDSEKCAFKSTSYMLLSMIPWDSGYNPCKMRINKMLSPEIKCNFIYVSMHTASVAILKELFCLRNKTLSSFTQMVFLPMNSAWPSNSLSHISLPAQTWCAIDQVPCMSCGWRSAAKATLTNTITKRLCPHPGSPLSKKLTRSRNNQLTGQGQTAHHV